MPGQIQPGSDTFGHGEAEECMTLRSKPKGTETSCCNYPLCMKPSMQTHVDVRLYSTHILFSPRKSNISLPIS